MARYRKIDTRIWNDFKFNSLKDDAKLLLFFLLTHPHLTSIGAMRISSLGLAGELNWNEAKLKEALNEVIAKDIVKYDERALLLWLPNFLKYNSPESPNVVKSWEHAVDYLPECPLKCELMSHARLFLKDFSIAFQEALPKAFGKGMPNQEQEQEQEQEHSNMIKNQSIENATSIANSHNENLCQNIKKDLTLSFAIPLKDNNHYLISDDFIVKLQSLYPSLDIVKELSNIHRWNLENPDKRKSQSSILNHIHIWLSRTQKNNTQNTAKYINKFTPTTLKNNLFEYNKTIAEQWSKQSIKTIKGDKIYESS